MNGRIDLVCGTLGGGKTLYAVEQIYWHLWAGGSVWTNITLFPDAIAARMRLYGRVLEPSRIHELPKDDLSGFESQLERGSGSMNTLIVLDEAALQWAARDYKKTQQKEATLLDFCTMVRKLNMHLIFISQDPTGIDKNMRTRAENLIMCRNFRHFELLGLFPLPIPLSVRTKHTTGIGTKKPQKQGTEFFMSRKWIWPLYDSDALHGKEAHRYAALAVAEHSPLKRCKPEILNELATSGFKRVRRFLSSPEDLILCALLYVLLSS